MRKRLSWFGWAVLFVLPIAYVTEVVVRQDLPDVQPWKWAILAGAVLLVYFARDTDEVIKHHVV